MNEIVNHDSTGRFAAGNKASAGRQRPDARTARSRGAELRRAWSDAIEPSDIERIKSTLLQIAHDATHPKCVDACKLILERLFGKPKLSIEVDASVTARQERADQEEREFAQIVMQDDKARHLAADLQRRVAMIGKDMDGAIIEDETARRLADDLERRVVQIEESQNETGTDSAR